MKTKVQIKGETSKLYELINKLPILSSNIKNRIAFFLSESENPLICVFTDRLAQSRIEVTSDGFFQDVDVVIASVAVPLLKNLRDNKNSFSEVEDSDVPAWLKYTPGGDEHTEGLLRRRYMWVLDYMIWSLEQCAESTSEDWLFQDHTAPVSTNTYKAYYSCRREGLRLFGKYFNTLWN